MDKDTLQNKVVKKLIAMVACGQYGGVESLPAERKLAQQFGVSRGTLRKALEQLAELGLVDIKPGSGAYVHQRSFADVPEALLPAGVRKVSIEDMMAARKAIEVAAIDAAVKKMTDEQVSHLQKIVSDMAYFVTNLPEFVRLDMAFHRYLVECSDNPVLLAAYNAIDEYHRYLQVVTTQNDECEQLSLAYHLRIAASVAKRDCALAKQVLAEHLDNVVDQMR